MQEDGVWIVYSECRFILREPMRRGCERSEPVLRARLADFTSRESLPRLRGGAEPCLRRVGRVRGLGCGRPWVFVLGVTWVSFAFECEFGCEFDLQRLHVGV